MGRQGWTGLSSGTEPLMTSALPHQVSCMGSQARFCCRVCGLPQTILPPQPGLILLLSRDSALAALASKLGPLTPSFPRSAVSLQASSECSAEALYCIPSQQDCGHTPEKSEFKEGLSVNKGVSPPQLLWPRARIQMNPPTASPQPPPPF